MAKTKRQSGIELLRILAMLQIIFLHISQYGKLHHTAMESESIYRFIVPIMWSLCRAPVDVFVMISGYFMITSKFDINKTFDRAKKTYGAMIFYSLAISTIFFITTPNLINIPNVIKAFTPLLSKTWYFLSNYIIILLISPFLNKMLLSLTKKQYLYFAGVIFAVMSVWSTIANIGGLDKIFSIEKIVDPYYGKSLGGFLLMYIIGGYIRLFFPQEVFEKRKAKLKYLIIFFILCAIDFSLAYFIKSYKDVYGMFNNPLVVFESVMLIMFFRDLKFSSSFINTIAGTTIGIYAIHEHPFVRKWVWSIFTFKDKSLYNSPLLIVKVVTVCITVFMVCCIIELIRLKIFLIFSKFSEFVKSKNKAQ